MRAATPPTLPSSREGPLPQPGPSLSNQSPLWSVPVSLRGWGTGAKKIIVDTQRENLLRIKQLWRNPGPENLLKPPCRLHTRSPSSWASGDRMLTHTLLAQPHAWRVTAFQFAQRYKLVI